MSLNKKLIPDLLLVGINQVIDRTTAATSFVLQGVRAIFDPSNPQNTELYYRDDAGGEHYFPSSEKLADPSAGDDIGINAAGVTATKLNPALAELKSTGGTPSTGVSGVLNIANGSGGWLAMDGSARPLLQWSSTTGNLSFTGGNFLISETVQATDKFDVVDDSGEIRFRDSTDSSTLARFYIQKDALGAGLHRLWVADAEEFAVPINAALAGDVTIDNISDSGTDTGKKMVVVDTTTKKIEERPIPSAGSASQGAQYDFNVADGSGGWYALSTANGPRFYLNSATNEIIYEYHLKASILKAHYQIDINYDSGVFNFKDTAGTSTLAQIAIIKDGVSSGLHELLLWQCERVKISANCQIVNDLVANSDVQFTSLIDSGTNTNKEMVVWDNTTAKIERRPMPTSGSASQGAQYDFNVADGSGGWTALDGSSFPRLYLDSSTNVIKYQAPIEGSSIISNFSLDLNYDSGTLQYNDTAGTTLLAEIKIIKDSLGAGLHELKVFTAKRFTVNQDFRVNGQTSMPALVDNGTNTGKKMLVIDTTSKEVEERPIPSSTDADAIHTNVAGEIFSLTTKTNPSVDDVLVIEDSTDSNNKKRILVSSLRGGIDSFTNPSGIIPNALTTRQINANAQAQLLSIGLPTNGYDGAKMIYRIRATSTSTLSWDVNFNDLRGVLPSSAPINKTIYVGVIYDGYSSTWDVVSVVEQS